MKRAITGILRLFFSILFSAITAFNLLYARAGGAGGGGHGGGGFGGGHGGGYGIGHGGGYYGGGSIGPVGIILIIIVVVIVLLLRNKFTGNVNTDEQAGGDLSSGGIPVETESAHLPDGLDEQKIKTAFLGIQVAWQNKDLREVRKWISDGVYQRFTTQFSMMNKLEQVDRLSNIRVEGIRLAKTAEDGKYQSADVAVSFIMDDEFSSKKYPQFNESFMDDSDTEYWTFIKRGDAGEGKNLYDNNNCPHCGAPLEIKMGEISRCAHCGSLTNNAAFDWVLCEITQDADYEQKGGTADEAGLRELTKNDERFAIARMDDIASNAFMQIMEVWSGGNAARLQRFADKDMVQSIEKLKSGMQTFVFDRLYLNDVNLVKYNTDSGRLNLMYRMEATFQRVQAGTELRWIDREMTTSRFRMVLSKNLNALKTPAKETVYSYECPHCGAPFKDTAGENCAYCGALLIDLNSTWVVTGFGEEI